MGQKVNPISFRVGINKTWSSRWFSEGKKYREYFLEDVKIRSFILKKLKNAGVARCEIERGPQVIKVNIYSSRPGIIIGRGGMGIEDLKKEVKKIISGRRIKLEINITEIKNPEENAFLVAQIIAEQLEKRISFRKILKKAIEKSRQSRNVQGIKVMVAGRLDGTDIARTEWLASGKIPLHTLRANVDFVTHVAHTIFGIIGIKVWIYKGEVFEKASKMNRLRLNHEEMGKVKV